MFFCTPQIFLQEDDMGVLDGSHQCYVDDFTAMPQIPLLGKVPSRWNRAKEPRTIFLGKDEKPYLRKVVMRIQTNKTDSQLNKAINSESWREQWI